ncbi:hypothetical protein TNCV_4749321 [Trichonephila clavipes]|nr:hypothetical protein TNCV_4749321 [Trichonephila clavipes]
MFEEGEIIPLKFWRTAYEGSEGRSIRYLGTFRSKTEYLNRHTKMIVIAWWLLLVYIDTTPPHYPHASDSANRTATAGSDVVQSGGPIFDDFFQHLWPYIDNNTANVVFQMVKRLWLIRIDQ